MAGMSQTTGGFSPLTPPKAAEKMAIGVKATGRSDSEKGSVPKADGGTGNSMELGGGRKKKELAMPATSMGQ